MKIFRAHFCDKKNAALLDATLRLPPGAQVFSESDETDLRQVWQVSCPAEILAAEMEAEAASCDVLRVINESPTVSAALAENAERIGLVASDFLNVVRFWIESGVLSEVDLLANPGSE